MNTHRTQTSDHLIVSITDSFSITKFRFLIDNVYDLLLNTIQWFNIIDTINSQKISTRDNVRSHGRQYRIMGHIIASTLIRIFVATKSVVRPSRFVSVSFFLKSRLLSRQKTTFAEFLHPNHHWQLARQQPEQGLKLKQKQPPRQLPLPVDNFYLLVDHGGLYKLGNTVFLQACLRIRFTAA